VRSTCRWTLAVLAFGAVLVAGCERAVLEPVEQVEEYDLLWDLQAGDQIDAEARRPDVPILVRLFRHALHRIDQEEGRDAARQAADAVAQIRAEARALLEAGDREGARARMQEARRAMAAVVVRAFGSEPVHRLLALVAQHQERIDRLIAEREAAGNDPQVLKRFQAHLSELTRTARAALDAGDPAAALDYASRAAEALVRFHARHGGQTGHG
jgi:hypothetical protein